MIVAWSFLKLKLFDVIENDDSISNITLHPKLTSEFHKCTLRSRMGDERFENYGTVQWMTLKVDNDCLRFLSNVAHLVILIATIRYKFCFLLNCIRFL